MEPTTPSARAIEALYTTYHQPIQRYLERLLSNHETAEDLTHETFIKALRHWEQLEQAASVRGWLYRIATNTAYDYLRRKRRVEITTLTDEHTTTCIAPAMELRIDDAEPIQAALQHIPEHYRLPLLLAAAGYDHKDIAAALKSNPNTIKTRVHRGRVRFRQVYTT
jgi:RNA polymerase sigma-70 factor (ECF subfamily)